MCHIFYFLPDTTLFHYCATISLSRNAGTSYTLLSHLINDNIELARRTYLSCVWSSSRVLYRMPPIPPLLITPQRVAQINTLYRSLNSEYQLVVRQQPKQARICSTSDKRKSRLMGFLKVRVDRLASQ